MYESHFGFTGAPFSLNPDPTFFFGSKVHSNALSYLKFGVYQGEGFVVVTGEIGAGKTTLVGTLLSELDKERIVAAQIVSTQLEAGDLLRSVALAFGIAPKNLSKAELIATIEAFLTLLVTENKRALLIVDEAQNLNRAAVEELRMLSNFQLGNQALLQSFLIGQPELRALLTSKPMEQFRQRVIASCHLGPMDREETQGYIEHRMQQVGWNGEPIFDAESFDRIFHWTSGIPRRVNLLCNRLLLSAYLASQSHIDANAVEMVAREVRSEIGEPVAKLIPVRVTGEAARAESIVAIAPPKIAMPRLQPPPSPIVAGPLVCVAASATDDVKMAVLLQALARHEGMPPALRVRIGEPARFAINDGFWAQLGVGAAVVPLHASETSTIGQLAEVLKQFATIVDEHRPSVVVVAGCSDSALACALAASKKHCRVVHVDAGVRASSSVAAGDAINNLLIDRVAELFYPSESSAYLNLIREGVAETKVQHAGDLLVDATRAAAALALPVQSVLQRCGVAAETAAGDYGWVVLDHAIMHADRDTVVEMLASLRESARERQLVWPMSRAVEERLRIFGLREHETHPRMSIIAPVGHVDGVSLLGGAALVVTDSLDVQLQAAVMQVRCVMVGHRRSEGAGTAPRKPQEGDAGGRIAEHLAGWLGNAAAAAA